MEILSRLIFVHAKIKGMQPKTKRAFTLIEMIVVIAIIGILAATIMVSLSTARLKTLSLQGLSDLEEVRLGLEAYKADAGKYPDTLTGALYCGWEGYNSSYGCQSSPSKCWIPELGQEGYCPLPIEKTRTNPGETEYLYASDGINYKLIYHRPPSMAVPPEYIDPNRPTWAFGFWTPGAGGW